MEKGKVSEFLKKYTMVIVLVIVVLFFTWQTGGRMILPQNVNNLIAQNAYVFILATGMLLCILTGGNIDLSVGSVVCFVGAVGATVMVNMKMNVFIGIIVMLAVGLAIGVWQGFWIAYRRIPPFVVTLAGMLMFRGLSNIVLDGTGTEHHMRAHRCDRGSHLYPHHFQGQDVQDKEGLCSK